jgi:hypothetical protein
VTAPSYAKADAVQICRSALVVLRQGEALRWRAGTGIRRGIDGTEISVRAHRDSALLFAHADRRTWQRWAQNGPPTPISVPAVIEFGRSRTSDLAHSPDSPGVPRECAIVNQGAQNCRSALLPKYAIDAYRAPRLTVRIGSRCPPGGVSSVVN